MQFSVRSALSLFAILSASVMADDSNLENIGLYVESDNTEIDGNGLSSKHSGAGIDYFFLGTGSETLIFDSSKAQIYKNFAGQYEQYFDVATSNYVQMTVSDANIASVQFTQVDGGKQYLTLGSSQDGFYACKNVNDPYNYSASSYELMYYADGNVNNDSCVAVKVYREVN
ncbi:unnamed protein product [Ambrosiozyma monospora]|uniref:Unnamed protein product n=1 Tax=Ambrosiozyma monospora TaxID=43982 RepID=A0ACB5SS03_AMBMO|nr:unnamed protein product [Ambrosiozyma monospora]